MDTKEGPQICNTSSFHGNFTWQPKKSLGCRRKAKSSKLISWTHSKEASCAVWGGLADRKIRSNWWERLTMTFPTEPAVMQASSALTEKQSHFLCYVPSWIELNFRRLWEANSLDSLGLSSSFELHGLAVKVATAKGFIWLGLYKAL